jgi:hypothetical protein
MTTATAATVKPLVKGDSLHISGRRWFQTTYGNTYHSVTVYVNGQEVLHVPFRYGYESHYLQTAAEALKEAGYLPGYDNTTVLWRYCQEHGINLSNEATDVKRKKDL